MQFIAILLLIILAKMGYDIYREQQHKIKPKSKKTGQVIDISDTWINIDKLPYRKKDYLLNNRELVVYDTLDHLLMERSTDFLPKFSWQIFCRLLRMLQTVRSTIKE